MLLFYRFLHNPSSSSHLDPFFSSKNRNVQHGAAPQRPTQTPPVLLACSATTSRNPDWLHSGNGTRRLCEDRRGIFNHLRPRLLIKNSIRVIVMQSTTVVTNYYNDQLKEDMEREDRIQKGEITRAQANKEDDEWQEVCARKGDFCLC